MSNVGSNAKGHTPDAKNARIRNLRRALRQMQRVYDARTRHAQDLFRLTCTLREQLHAGRSCMTAEEQVKAIQARLDGISVTPWTLDERYPRKVYCDDTLGSIVADCDVERFSSVPTSARDANAEFIANAPTDIAALLAERVGLRAMLATFACELGRVPDPRISDLRTADVREFTQRASHFAATARSLTPDEIASICAALSGSPGADHGK